MALSSPPPPHLRQRCGSFDFQALWRCLSLSSCSSSLVPLGTALSSSWVIAYLLALPLLCGLYPCLTYSLQLVPFQIFFLHWEAFLALACQSVRQVSGRPPETYKAICVCKISSKKACRVLSSLLCEGNLIASASCFLFGYVFLLQEAV